MTAKANDMKATEKEFGADRTERCIELMKPEVRAMIDWPLSKKVKKTEEIIRESIRKYKTVGVGFSGGADSEAMLHIALKIKHDMPIMMVDTHYEFPETFTFIEKLRKEWNFESFTIVRAAYDRARELES